VVGTNGFDVDRFVKVTAGAVFDYGGLMGDFFAAPVAGGLHFPVRVGKVWELRDEAAHLHVVATVEAVEPLGTAGACSARCACATTLRTLRRTARPWTCMLATAARGGSCLASAW